MESEKTYSEPADSKSRVRSYLQLHDVSLVFSSGDLILRPPLLLPLSITCRRLGLTKYVGSEPRRYFPAATPEKIKISNASIPCAMRRNVSQSGRLMSGPGRRASRDIAKRFMIFAVLVALGEAFWITMTARKTGIWSQDQETERRRETEAGLGKARGQQREQKAYPQANKHLITSGTWFQPCCRSFRN